MPQAQTFWPDPTFYASRRLTMEAPVEKHGFTLLLSPDRAKPDAIAVVDLDPASPDYGQVVLATGAVLAWAGYRWFGPRPIGATSFNLDRIWAASLVLAGGVGCAAAMRS